MARTHHLDDSVVHYAWDNSIAPRIVVDPGDVIVFETRDSADYFYNATSDHADVLRKGPLKGHPLTGPVHVRGAEVGDTLIVDILDIAPRLGFGWTAIRPGRGLLPADEFPDPFLQIWTLSDDGLARMRHRRDIAVPVASFPGIVGVALAAPCAHSTIPPRENGGNMDQKHLTRGARLYLPVLFEGALLSVGDVHAAQGDGEVCITAIETAGAITLRVGLEKGQTVREPQFRTAGPLCAGTNRGPHLATMSHGPDLFACARQSIRYMIERLCTERALSREEAYVLCSVCADLKISQIVDTPNWTVAAFLPETVFVEP